MIKAVVLSASIVLGVPVVAFATDKCADPQDQSTMNECAGMAFKASDKKLNELYRQIETRLGDDAETKKLLIQAQRDWIKFRDAECSFQAAGVSGGSAMPMVVSMCMDGLTQTRVKDFEGYLSCEEGDMSCAVPAAN